MVHQIMLFTKKMTIIMLHSLTRERTINGGPYSYSVPGTDIVWPSPIPENERLFWRQSIEKYAHYHLEEFPLKRNNGMSEDIGDLAWRILLFSKYPDIDLLLYLKQDEMSFPIILLLREGKINAVDFRKLSSSPKVLQRKFLFQIHRALRPVIIKVALDGTFGRSPVSLRILLISIQLNRCRISLVITLRSGE